VIRVGTSGWSQPAIRQALPRARLAPGEMLRAYARALDTVEINSTFYRFHRPDTFPGWRERVPGGFTFAIKAHRLFTHERRLEDPGAELVGFLRAIGGLGSALGPVLFQLPHGFHADLGVLRRFLAALAGASAEAGLRAPRFVFELRHPSWHAPGTWRLLERAGAAFCVFDIRRFTAPAAVTAGFTYARLHGPLATPYEGRYGREALLPWAELLRGWEARGLDSFLYFDNTRFGEAVPDARELLGLLAPAAGVLRPALRPESRAARAG
jgi:uncharacterized protein YecE (DUF72 family)